MDPSQSCREAADPTVFLVSPTSLCCYLPLAEPRNQKTRGPIDPVYPEQPVGAQSKVQKGVFWWINRRYPAKKDKKRTKLLTTQRSWVVTVLDNKKADEFGIFPIKDNSRAEKKRMNRIKGKVKPQMVKIINQHLPTFNQLSQWACMKFKPAEKSYV